MSKAYVVIYLWQGQRHRDLHVFYMYADAREHLATFTSNGWRAWIEEL